MREEELERVGVIGCHTCAESVRVPKSRMKRSREGKSCESRMLSSAHSSVVLFCRGVPDSRCRCSTCSHNQRVPPTSLHHHHHHLPLLFTPGKPALSTTFTSQPPNPPTPSSARVYSGNNKLSPPLFSLHHTRTPPTPSFPCPIPLPPSLPSPRSLLPSSRNFSP